MTVCILNALSECLNWNPNCSMYLSAVHSVMLCGCGAVCEVASGVALDVFCNPLQLKKALLGPKRFAK